MADSFIMTAEQVRVVDNDETVFEGVDARRTVSYWPSEKLTGTVSVPFHNPPQDVAYGWSDVFDHVSTVGTNVYLETCKTHRTILPQECGPPDIPDVTMDFVFDNILLGTVPAGTNYLDIQVRLTRTKDPDDFYDAEVRKMQPTGVWLSGVGNAFPLEKMKEFRRHIDFFIDGTNVYLRRYQSTDDSNDLVFAPGNDASANGYWTYQSKKSATTFAFIEQKQRTHGGTNFSYRRTDGSHCAFDNAAKTDLSSTWQVEYEISPGRLDTTALPPVTPKPAVRFSGHYAPTSTTTTTATFADVSLLTTKASRYIVVHVGAYFTNNDTAIAATSVVVGGVAATKLLEVKGDRSSASLSAEFGSSLWIAPVPAGITADIVVTFDRFVRTSDISVFSVYDLTSPSAYATAAYSSQVTSTAPTFTGLTLSTPDDGVALAVVHGPNGNAGALTGFDDEAHAAFGAPDIPYLSGAWSSRTAGSISIGMGPPAGGGDKRPWSVLAVSFR